MPVGVDDDGVCRRGDVRADVLNRRRSDHDGPAAIGAPAAVKILAPLIA
jgi:hypothetical protein